MSSYKAGYVPDDLQELAFFLRTELARLELALNAPRSFVELEVLHAQPERVRGGMVVYADGSDWNPGSGAGVYRRSEDNTTWTHLG